MDDDADDFDVFEGNAALKWALAIFAVMAMMLAVTPGFLLE